MERHEVGGKGNGRVGTGTEELTDSRFDIELWVVEDGVVVVVAMVHKGRLSKQIQAVHVMNDL